MKGVLNYQINLRRFCSRLIYTFSFLIMFSLLFIRFSDALQMKYEDTKEEKDFLFDHYTDEGIFSPEFQSTLKIISQALLAGSYNYVLNIINQMGEGEKRIPEIKAREISALIGKQEFDAAQTKLDEFINSNRMPASSLALIAHHYTKANKPFEAAGVCQTGLIYNAANPILLYEMGRSYEAIGRPIIAKVYFKAANQNKSKLTRKIDLLFQDALADSYMQLKEYEKIKDVYGKIEAGINSTPTYLIAKARYMAFNGKFDEALNLINMAHQKRNDPGLLFVKAGFFIMDGKFQGALSLMDEVDKLDSDNSLQDKIILFKALTHQLMNSPQKALELINSIGEPEKIPNIMLLEATIYISIGKNNEVIEALKKSAPPFTEFAQYPEIKDNLKPSSMGSLYALAHFCFDQGYYLQAIKVIKSALEKSPDNFFLHYILAESLYRNRNYREAVIEFTKATKIFPQSIALKLQLARALEKAGAENEALAAYSAITQSRPDFLTAVFAHSRMLARLSRWPDARRVLESGLNFNPKSAPLLSSYGWMLCYEKLFKELENLMSELKENSNIKPATLKHLQGWTAYQQKDYVNARQLLRTALQEAPGDPEICFHLGMAAYKSSNLNEAKNLFVQTLYFTEQKEKYQYTIESLLKKSAN